MAHPFSKIFETALKKSKGDENYVLVEAEKLRARGYRIEEIYEVLKKLHMSLIGDVDMAILAEAIEEFGQYIEEE